LVSKQALIPIVKERGTFEDISQLLPRTLQENWQELTLLLLLLFFFVSLLFLQVSNPKQDQRDKEAVRKRELRAAKKVGEHWTVSERFKV